MPPVVAYGIPTIAPPPDLGHYYVATANQGDDSVSILEVLPDGTTTLIATWAAGSAPNGIAVSPDGLLLAVVNSGEPTVTIIDTTTGDTVTTLPVGGSWSPAFSHDGTMLAVAAWGDNTVTVIDVATWTVTATFPVGNGPLGVAFAADDSYIAVAEQTDGTVKTYAAPDWTSSSSAAAGTWPQGVDVAADGAYIAVAVDGDNAVFTFNPDTLDTNSIAVGNSPVGVGIDPALAFIVASNLNDDTVSVIETTGWTVTHTVAVGAGPYLLGIAPDSTFVAVPNSTDGTVTILRAFDWSEVTTIVVGAAPQALVVFPVPPPPTPPDIGDVGEYKIATANDDDDMTTLLDVDVDAIAHVDGTVAGEPGAAIAAAPDRSPLLAVTNPGDNTVTLIETTLNLVVAVIGVGGAPAGVAFSNDGSLLAVANSDDNTLSIIDVYTRDVIQTVGTNDAPFGVVFSQDDAYVAVSHTDGQRVLLYETTGWSIVAATILFSALRGIDFGPDGTYIAVAASDGNSVYILDPLTLDTLQQILVGSQPVGVKIDPEFDYIVVSHAGEDNVWVINTDDWSITTVVAVGASPGLLAVAPDSSFVAVPNSGDGTVSIIRTADWTVTSTEPVPNPQALVIYAEARERRGLCVAPRAPWNKAHPAWVRLDGLDAPRRLTSWRIDRGRSKELDKTENGTSSWNIIDRDGTFDTTVETGLAGEGGFDPLRQAQVMMWNPARDTESSIFRGFIDELDVLMDVTARRADVNLDLVDGFAIMADLEMHPTDPPRFGTTPALESAAQIYFPPTDDDPPYNDRWGIEVNARIHRALDQAGWPHSRRRIASGNETLQGAVYGRYDSLLSVIFDAAEAEFPGGVANAYMSKDGIACFHGRYLRFNATAYCADRDEHRRHGHPLVHWRAGGAEAAAADDRVAILAGVRFSRGLSDIYNVATILPQNVEIADVPTALIKNDASIERFGWRPISYEDLLVLRGVGSGLTAVEECKNFARFYVTNYKDPRTRVTQLIFRPRDARTFSGPATWDLMCGVDIGDPIELDTAHWGGLGGFNERYFVEGIHYEADATGRPDMPNVTLTLDVSPASFWAYNPFA